MIKINWSQVKNLKTHLLRQGFTKETELLVMVFYSQNIDSQKLKVQLDKIDNVLFTIESNPQVTGVFVFDVDAKKPLWRVREQEIMDSLESIPSSGHRNIVRDFASMPSEQKDVWIEICLASLQQHLANSEV